jgi:excisionase family DNA binding protein
MTKLLSVKEAADYLGVKPATIYDWRTDNKGPRAVKVGRLVKFRESDLDAYIDASAEPIRGAA